jgi:fibronectin-binding autotransporter adhesin
MASHLLALMDVVKRNQPVGGAPAAAAAASAAGGGAVPDNGQFTSLMQSIGGVNMTPAAMDVLAQLRGGAGAGAGYGGAAGGGGANNTLRPQVTVSIPGGGNAAPGGSDAAVWQNSALFTLTQRGAAGDAVPTPDMGSGLGSRRAGALAGSAATGGGGLPGDTYGINIYDAVMLTPHPTVPSSGGAAAGGGLGSSLATAAAAWRAASDSAAPVGSPRDGEGFPASTASAASSSAAAAAVGLSNLIASMAARGAGGGVGVGMLPADLASPATSGSGPLASSTSSGASPVPARGPSSARTAGSGTSPANEFDAVSQLLHLAAGQTPEGDAAASGVAVGKGLAASMQAATQAIAVGSDGSSPSGGTA